MECMNRKFDSHATIAGVETIDETALSMDKEEETAAEAREEDLAAEEAKERAQTMTIEEDTATAENTSTNIIHKGGIKTARAETTKDKNVEVSNLNMRLRRGNQNMRDVCDICDIWTS